MKPTEAEERAELEELRRLVPSAEMLALGYMVVRNGQVMVTPAGLEWLRSILPLIDCPSDPCRPTRPS